MNEVIPIIQEPDKPDQRVGERRANWHTPEDCHKLLDTQTSLANTQETLTKMSQRLEDGSARMTRIEDSVTHVNNCIKANNDAALIHRIKFEKTLEENTAATSEILEIISAAKGFFKTIGKLGDFLKWGLGIITAFVAFWLTIKNGGK
jgi:hypothetical protein